MKKQVLALLLLLPLAVLAQKSDTVRVVQQNKDTTLVITTSSQKTTSVSYTQTSVVLVVRSYQPSGGTDTGGGTTVPDPPLPAGSVLAYQNTFAVGTILDKNQCGRCSISTTYFPAGAFKAWYQAGDPEISGGYRDEQQYPQSYTPTGRDLTYIFDQVFEELPGDVQGLSMQTHGTISGTSGYGSMWVSNGVFAFQYQPSGIAGSTNIYQAKRADGGALETVQVGKRYHWYYNVRWSSGSDGYINIWLNGEKYYAATGKNCDGKGGYFKAGINLFNGKRTAKVHIANLRIYHN